MQLVMWSKAKQNIALKMGTVSSSEICWMQLRFVDLQEERRGWAEEKPFEVRQVNVMYL